MSKFLSPFLINIYQDKELDQNITSEDFSVVQKEGKIMSGDVVIAKNYLGKEELKDLDRIGDMCLNYAEMQPGRKGGPGEIPSRLSPLLFHHYF